MHKYVFLRAQISAIGIISCICFSCSLCCYLSLIFIAQQWIIQVLGFKEVGFFFLLLFGCVCVCVRVYVCVCLCVLTAVLRC